MVNQTVLSQQPSWMMDRSGRPVTRGYRVYPATGISRRWLAESTPRWAYVGSNGPR